MSKEVMDEYGAEWFVVIYPEGNAVYMRYEGISRENAAIELKDAADYLSKPQASDTVN